MTQGNFNDIEINRQIVTDRHGRPVLELQTQTRSTEQADGSELTERRTVLQEMEDGALVSPYEVVRPNGVRLARCDRCVRPRWRFPRRTSPSAGVVRLSAAARCRSCQALLCPAHQVRGPRDTVYCSSCWSRRALQRAVRRIFFSREVR